MTRTRVRFASKFRIVGLQTKKVLSRKRMSVHSRTTLGHFRSRRRFLALGFVRFPMFGLTRRAAVRRLAAAAAALEVNHSRQCDSDSRLARRRGYVLLPTVREALARGIGALLDGRRRARLRNSVGEASRAGRCEIEAALVAAIAEALRSRAGRKRRLNRRSPVSHCRESFCVFDCVRIGDVGKAGDKGRRDGENGMRAGAGRDQKLGDLQVTLQQNEKL